MEPYAKVNINYLFKASCAWILGEFAEFIPEVLKKMTEAGESFTQEERVV